MNSRIPKKVSFDYSLASSEVAMLTRSEARYIEKQKKITVEENPIDSLLIFKREFDSVLRTLDRTQCDSMGMRASFLDVEVIKRMYSTMDETIEYLASHKRYNSATFKVTLEPYWKAGNNKNFIRYDGLFLTLEITYSAGGDLSVKSKEGNAIVGGLPSTVVVPTELVCKRWPVLDFTRMPDKYVTFSFDEASFYRKPCFFDAKEKASKRNYFY